MEIQPTQNVRPGFLSVLCILSFIGLGLAILNNIKLLVMGIFGPLFYNLMQSRLEESLGQIQNTNPTLVPFLENLFESLLKLMDRAPVLAIISILFVVAALLGVIMMWKLMKKGFYIYSAAKIVLIILPLVVVGINFLTIFISLLGLLSAAIFITLYAFNLKAMN